MARCWPAVLAVVTAVLACNAHASFVCRDHWRNIYRMSAAPPSLDCEFEVSAETHAEMPASAPVAREQTSAAAPPAGKLAMGPAGTFRGGRLLMRTKRLATEDSPRPDGALDQLIASTAARYGHATNLLRAIVQVESRFNAAAISPKGAIGLMQVMPETARELGVSDPSTQLFDPAVNLDTGARLLRQLLDRFGDRPELAIAAYNAGTGAVLRHGREIPPYPETRAYVRDVMAEFTRLAR
jgi:soluble lytic murein transglycosylase-like protein